ncbi:MAG: glutamine synthetase, partial [Bartonella sp.]|nr:glutamine synthetase [Bartonella sp.]
PIQGQPGSAMHIHQSVIDQETGANIFTKEDDGESIYFSYFIGGLQRHMAGALVMLAPYVNSYRRLMPGISAPVNLRWGYDNRTTG